MLIKAAINGSRTRAEHPAVPVTAEEQAHAAQGAAVAGAGAGALAELLLSRGVALEAGLSELKAAEVFVAGGLAANSLRVLLEPQEPDAGGALRTVERIEALLDGAGIRPPRLLHGTGGTAWRLVLEAARRGLDTRIGLEDTLALPDGRMAVDNPALVAEAIRVIGSANRT